MNVQPKLPTDDACFLIVQPKHGPATMREAVRAWPLQLDVEPWRP